MMTKKQRFHMMAELWPNACNAQGWDKSDDAKRYEIFARVLTAEGHVNRERHLRTLERGDHISFNSFDNADFDAVKKELLHLAGKIPDPESGAVRGVKERLLWNIRNEAPKLIGLYHANPTAYIETICRERFKRVIGMNRLDDLSVGQLNQLRYTLTGRINSLRNKSGDSVHEMCAKAKIKCPVRGCRECLKTFTQDRLAEPWEPSETTVPADAEIPQSTEESPW